jgi:N-acetylneuraminic acid mutarotase
VKSRLLKLVGILSLCVSCKKDNSTHSTTPPVNTTPPVITDFNPKTGAPGIPILILGQNFGDSAGNILVEFNGTPATIYSIEDEDMTVIVPQGVTTGKISVKRTGLTSTSDSSFTALSGKQWKQLNGISSGDSANGRFVGIGFSIGNKGYMGLGDGNDGTFYNDLFQYDPATNSWTQMASCPAALADAVCMVINNVAYIGLGQTGIVTNSNAWFAYDPSTNVWTRKADFPGVGRASAIGVAMGNIGMVGLGFDKYGIQYADIWIYDPSTDNWTQKRDFSAPHIPELEVGFSLDNQTAFVTGTNYYQNNLSPVNVLYQYDPVADVWTEKQWRPGIPMQQPTAMVINGNGYILGGGEEDWMYQSGTDSWTQIPFFTERRGAAAFTIGNTGYFGNGTGLYVNAMTDLWQFSP